LIAKLSDAKYSYRSDITSHSLLGLNFREKFEALNSVKLTDNEFFRLLSDIITPDVFKASKILRNINAFTRDDSTSLNYTLVNLKDWCRNHFEVFNQLSINTDSSRWRQAPHLGVGSGTPPVVGTPSICSWGIATEGQTRFCCAWGCTSGGRHCPAGVGLVKPERWGLSLSRQARRQGQVCRKRQV